MKNVVFLLLLRYVTMGILYGCTLFSRVNCQSCSVITNSTCFDLDYCQTGSDGIDDLECYKQYLENHLTCTWKPGTRASNATTYTLITEQIDRSKCKRCKNILNTFHLIEGLFSKNSVTIWVVESDPNRNCSKAIFKGTPNQLVQQQCLRIQCHCQRRIWRISRDLQHYPSRDQSDSLSICLLGSCCSF